MSGIPSELWLQLRKVFMECDVFESDRKLREFFQRESLSPFKSSLPEADSVGARADMLIAYLHNKARAVGISQKWFDGKNVLLIFIGELFLYYRQNPSDAPIVFVDFAQVLSQRSLLLLPEKR